jgi:ribosomal protein L24
MKRVRAEPENDAKSGIKATSHPVHVSNVALIDPES